MKSPNYPGIHSTELAPRSSRPAAPRLNGFWRSVALVSALATGAAACGSESRSEIGEEGKPDAGAVTAPDSGVEPVQDAGGPVFVDAGTEADAGTGVDAGADAGSSAADAGSDAGAAPLPDDDGDGVPNDRDVCRQTPDFIGSDGLPLNTDGDALPNACDPCPARAPQAGEDPAADADGDGLGDGCDNAPNTPNYTQTDRDNDGVGDIVDNSPEFNPEQTDADNDGYGAGWDCDDNDRTIHPGAVEESCAPVDRNCDGRGGLLRQNPDGSAVFNGEPECSCVPGTVRPIGRTVAGSPCVAGEETCVVRGEVSGYEMTTVPEGNPNTPETCNGADDNCNGTVDEGCGCTPPNSTRACGPEEVGKCLPGTQTCIAGTWGPCENAVEADEEEVCNGVDDDCNGTVDDGTFGGAGGTPSQAKRGRGACGLDDSTTVGVDEGLGRVECDGPNATKVSVNPGGSADRSLDYDACNGVDDDCDGRIDEEDYSGAGAKGLPCSLPGKCGEGVTVCLSDLATHCNSDARRGTLNPADLESAAGLCNGVDDNCSGEVDEGCACDPGETQACGSNVGLCNEGVITCSNTDGRFVGACGGPNFVGPTAEVCNGEDDDCDGVTDEFANGRAGQACRGRTLSICDVDGELVCDTANGGLRCTANDRAVPETCNGADDDCNGVVDNGLGVGTDCEGVGECGPGKMECRTDGTTGCSTDSDGSRSQATIEMCNQKDDDCDGSTDEGCRTCNPEATQNCGSDVGTCEFGRQTCDANGAWGTCAGGVGAQPELCNGLDDNCNGTVDETFETLGLGDVCDGEGACGSGTIQCKADGSGVVCSTDIGGSNPGDTTERCNGVDEDCDGVIDNGIGTLGLPGTVCREPGRCGDGLVECTGLNSLATQCSSISKRIAETCNGVDDDCNTVVDDNYDVGGACNLPGICSTGVKRCMANGTNTECSSKDKAVAEVCNGLDDDCDNLTDETFTVGGVRVGGRCTLSGCGAGTVRCKDDATAECSSIDRQVPEIPANLIDDDCDGSTDETTP